jgi:hypothetical protein
VEGVNLVLLAALPALAICLSCINACLSKRPSLMRPSSECTGLAALTRGRPPAKSYSSSSLLNHVRPERRTKLLTLEGRSVGRGWHSPLAQSLRKSPFCQQIKEESLQVQRTRAKPPARHRSRNLARPDCFQEEQAFVWNCVLL